MKLNQFKQLSITIFLSLQFLAQQSVQAKFLIRSNYHINTELLCDGYPRLNVSTLPGYCLGLLLSKENGMRMPRYAVQAKDGVIYISDMGGWDFGSGRILAAYRDGNQKLQLVSLFQKTKLTMPNGLLLDPEGRLYVGLPSGIIRFQPIKMINGKRQWNIDPQFEIVTQTIQQSLFRKTEFSSKVNYDAVEKPNKNKHPLLQIASNSDFTKIYYNVGAPSNDCGYGFKTVDASGKCIQAESPLASAAVWEIGLTKDTNRKVLSEKVFSRGLRNSMGLVVHSSGAVLQAENGVDLVDDDKPFEEINLLQLGAHYGWPYCHSIGEVSPRFIDKVSAEQCIKQYTKPSLFLPAHSAPLSLLFQSKNDQLSQPLMKVKSVSDIYGKLSQFLFVSLHGYKSTGHKIVTFPFDQQAKPLLSVPTEVIFDWENDGETRPTGAPVGLLKGSDGSLLIIDDKNAAVYRLSRSDERIPAKDDYLGRQIKKLELSEESIKLLSPLVPWFKKNCSLCHTEFQTDVAKDLANNLIKGMVDRENPEKSKILEKLNKQEMPPEMIRQSIAFKNTDYPMIIEKLKIFLNTL